MSAAGELADLNLDETGVRLGAQDQRERQALNRSGQGIGASEILANLGLSDAGIRFDALDDIEGAALRRDQTGLQAGGLLADFESGERNRGLEASGLLAGLSDSERSRALAALDRLPEAGLLDSNLLSQIGDAQQDQDQRELSAPIDFQQILLAAARSGLPIESLLGENIRGRQRGFSLGFGG